MEKSNFDQLMQRYLTGQVTEQERIKIEAWLDEQKTDDTTDLDLSKEDEEKIFQHLSTKHGIGKTPTKKKGNGLFLFKVAASFLVVALLSYSAWTLFNRSTTTTEILSVNGTDRVILNDGTIVWLRENSDVTYFEKTEGNTTYRHAKIKGEALFEVTKDQSRPFIIECGDVKVRVLGTSFHLKFIDNNVELSLLTGKVSMSATNNSTVDVEPNEKVIYKGNGQFEKISLTKTEETSIVKDTEYKLAFSDVSMNELLTHLEKKFAIDIDVKNDKIKECKISIDLTDRSLEKSLQMIADVLHVDYSLQGKVVTLSGSGCD
jgi:ferric-dicitrate binding protein FerR (iron transport regulator)